METEPTPARVWIDKQTPEAYHALSALSLALHHAATAAGLDRVLIELINVRVSQLNGCPFCLNLHTRAAVEAGVTQQQLDVLEGWRRADLYTPLQRAALALAETTTILPGEQILEHEYALARQHMSDDQVSVVIWAATTIGAFNRVSIMSRHPVRARKES
ncbi:carboxymuconolactone decarboxylase family protein [Nocardia alni]|uniref:carboxymuconolactone decarboxylase family protein n=1 Tax=Nocardia alni TaxID=2815723 RepID=UPI001C213D9C|nr:carboxymuconolactone decarboxylase family protein [Nocardia alni]